MRKRLIPSIILAIYSTVVVKLVVFKTVFFQFSRMRFRITPGMGAEDNFIPFKTIVSYLRGDRGWFIAFYNIVGNVALFVPIGLLVPLVFEKMNWKKMGTVAVAIGLTIELTETILKVGIFDVDDIMLNTLGVLMGYGIHKIWVARKR